MPTGRAALFQSATDRTVDNAVATRTTETRPFGRLTTAGIAPVQPLSRVLAAVDGLASGVVTGPWVFPAMGSGSLARATAVGQLFRRLSRSHSSAVVTNARSVGNPCLDAVDPQERERAACGTIVAISHARLTPSERRPVATAHSTSAGGKTKIA